MISNKEIKFYKYLFTISIIIALLSSVISLILFYDFKKDEAKISGSKFDLLYIGPINYKNSYRLTNFIKENDDESNNSKNPKIISVSSFGGEYQGAMEMADTINRNNFTMLVRDGWVCASACMYVFAYSHRHLATEDSIFGIHRSRRGEFSLGERILQIVRRSHPIELNLPENVMLSWANKISPRLGQFLSSCSVDPTRRDAMFWLRGQEINEISYGSQKYSCDELMKRDSKWLERYQKQVRERELKAHEAQR